MLLVNSSHSFTILASLNEARFFPGRYFREQGKVGAIWEGTEEGKGRGRVGQRALKMAKNVWSCHCIIISYYCPDIVEINHPTWSLVLRMYVWSSWWCLMMRNTCLDVSHCIMAVKGFSLLCICNIEYDAARRWLWVSLITRLAQQSWEV